ncbi:unnamed protein product, partial [Ectocarpus sp. 12 AP-2014]
VCSNWNDPPSSATLFKHFDQAKGHQPPGWYYCFGGSRVELCGPFESLDVAKSYAAEAMSGIADDPSSEFGGEFGGKRPRGAENEGATRKANDATTGGGGGGGSGSGGD